MSEAGGPPGEHPYDPIDLRRQIAVSFSTPELRQLAETLGVGGSVRWDHGPQEAVRDLVRQFERYYGLGTLVAKLKELRPLVNWPEPDVLPPPASQAQKPTVEAAPLPPVADPLGGAPIADPLLGPPAPGAAPPAPTLIEPAPPPVSTPVPSAAPSRPAPVWPGTVSAGPEPPRSQGIDARVLVLVAGLTVLAAVIAYAAGRASNGGAVAQAPAEAATTIAAAPTPRRAPGPATRVADAVSRSLASVARSCELPPGTEVNAELLARAFERCGPPSPRAALTYDRLPIPVPTLDPPRDAPPEPGRSRSPRPSSPAPPPDKSGPSNACLGKCAGESRSCYASCGAEPQQSTQYDAYMHCRSRCMSVLSKCRLACPQ